MTVPLDETPAGTIDFTALDRVLELQGGIQANVKPGDVLTFIPAHACG